MRAIYCYDILTLQITAGDVRVKFSNKSTKIETNRFLDNESTCDVIPSMKGSIYHGATYSGTKVRTIVTLVPAEQGRYRLELRHLNFDPYPCRTCAGPWVTLVHTHATMRMPYFWNDGNDCAFKNKSLSGQVSTINGTATLLYSSSWWSRSWVTSAGTRV